MKNNEQRPQLFPSYGALISRSHHSSYHKSTKVLNKSGYLYMFSKKISNMKLEERKSEYSKCGSIVGGKCPYTTKCAEYPAQFSKGTKHSHQKGSKLSPEM